MNVKKSRIALALYALLFANGSYIAVAQSCDISPLKPLLLPSDSANNSDNGMVDIQADHADYYEDRLKVTGNVVIDYDGRKMRGEEFLYNTAQELISSDQLIYYSDNEVALQGYNFAHKVNKEETSVSDAHYYINSGTQEGQGRAKSLLHKNLEEKSDLSESTYSTCPISNEIWHLESRDLTLDHTTGRGIAKNARFKVFNTPLLYTPYISFPIDDKRHSGFLAPIFTLGKNDGLTLNLPYYFNIAPNLDATLTPGIYTNRGVMLGGELRYLTPKQYFTLRGEYMPQDSNYDKEDRWSIYFKQDWRFTPRLRGNILFQQVSDGDFLKDFDNEVGLLTTTNLERRADLYYQADSWQARLRFQDFYIINRQVTPNKPYARYPQLTFDGEWYKEGFRYGVNAEAVHFRTSVKENWANRRPHRANRLDLHAYINYRLENSWGFIAPEIAIRETYYHIKYDQDYTNRKDDNINRFLPIFSLDSGIFLERETSSQHLLGGGDFIQTLEPRLFYLYVPYRSQEDIPLFDTSARTANYQALFYKNRYVGTDRHSDANQITMALTTRYLAQATGEELLRLSAGQTHHFTNPRITLGKDLTTEEARDYRSSWFFEGEMKLFRDFYTDFTLQWAPKSRKTNRATLDLRYQPSARKIINFGYRYNRGERDYFTNRESPIDQFDFTTFWELNSRWAVVGRYNYSIESKKMVDSYLGFEFNDCCVNTRVMARYYRDTPASETQWKAYLQFELKGLGSVGQNASGLWNDTIPGYYPTRF